MPKITLRHLTLEEEDKFYKANNAPWEGWTFALDFESVCQSNYEKYLDFLKKAPKGEDLPEGYVPCTFLFAFNEADELVGRTSIRHELNDFLLKLGGHVGYGVVPEHRKKGYASEIMKESIAYIQKTLPHLDKILVTCDVGNIGSEKTILKHGGVLENVIQVKDDGAKTQRFWIDLKAK